MRRYAKCNFNLANLRIRQQKLTPCTCHSRCGTIKIPLGCSGDTNAVSSQSSSYEWNTFEYDIKQYSVNQFKGKLSFCERREVFWRALPRTMTLDMFGVETAFWNLTLFYHPNFTQFFYLDPRNNALPHWLMKVLSSVKIIWIHPWIHDEGHQLSITERFYFFFYIHIFNYIGDISFIATTPSVRYLPLDTQPEMLIKFLALYWIDWCETEQSATVSRSEFKWIFSFSCCRLHRAKKII